MRHWTLLLGLSVLLAAQTARARTIYVSTQSGQDTNDGLTAETAVATLGKGATLVRGGDDLVVGPGVYYEKAVFQNLGSSTDLPVWIRADPIGGATVSAAWPESAKGEVAWQDEGDGVYSAPHGPCLFGRHGERYLFRFNSLADLRAAHVTANGKEFVTPEDGFAIQDGKVYVRLAGRKNPNGESIHLSPPNWAEEGRAEAINVLNSPSVIIDGLRIADSGTICAYFDEASTGATIRNSAFLNCGVGTTLSHDSVIEWSEYTYPGFQTLVSELSDLNGGSTFAIYHLVKEYRPGDLQGGLAETYGAAGHTSNHCEFRYNYLHDSFVGESLGSFEYSESHHNVYLHNPGNHIELESWANFGARELRVHDSLFLSSTGGPISHQEESIVGPHYVYRNVVYGLDAFGMDIAFIIKSQMTTAPGGVFYYHNLLWAGKAGLFWDAEPRQMLHFRNNMFVFSQNADIENGAFDSDYNLFVNNVDAPWLYGPSGKYLGSDPAVFDFLSVKDLNFGISEQSPAVDAGTPIPGFNDNAKGLPDIGPFEAGTDPGTDWPRPRRTVYKCDPPDGWKGPVPKYACEQDPAVVETPGGSDAPSLGEGAGAAAEAKQLEEGAASEGEGCGCKVAGSPTRRLGGVAAVLMLAGAFTVRRRRREMRER